jgi:serine/threonine-protein kinase
MPSPRVPAAGDIIAHKYQVERVLGAGGMGVVLAARHLQLGQRVAIKFIRQEYATDGQVVSRFLREAHAAVALSSEHSTRVFDAGLMDGGEPYMVMEYLDGTDLDQVLRREGPMPVVRAVDFLLQACEAIAEAHARGIVHRDLKPSNLFLTRRFDGSPLVKVLDFGVSKLSTQVALSPGDLTSTGTIVGSPHYMSPEQMVSTKDVDALTDVWALGVILYQFLTGRVPFPGETIAEIAIMSATQEPPPLSRPDVPPQLEAAVLKCLQKDRRARCGSVVELARAIAEFAPPGSRAIVERLSVAPAAPTPGSSQAPPVVETLMAPGVTPPTLTRVGPGVPESGTMSPVGGTGPGVARRKGGVVGIVSLALAGVAVAAGAIALSVGHGKKDVATGLATATPSVASVDAAAATAVVAPAAVPPAPPAETHAPVAPEAPAAAAPLRADAPSPGQSLPATRAGAEQHRAPPATGGDTPSRRRAQPAAPAPVYNPLDHL